MNLLDVVHPAAKTLVDISLSQDAEVGDGTTSVVLLGAEFLRQAKPFIEENMHPQMIIKVRCSIQNVASLPGPHLSLVSSPPICRATARLASSRSRRSRRSRFALPTRTKSAAARCSSV